MNMLVDSHCHLDFPDFEEDLDDVVCRAEAEGVGLMVTICTRVRQFHSIKAVAERFDNVYCSVGLHPHSVVEEPELTSENLIQIARYDKVVGIGETGLDYYYNHSSREEQRVKFREHISAARLTGLPLIIHSRNADEDMIQILRSEMEVGIFTGVLHCFSSSLVLAETAIELGFYISFSGIITFKNADDLRAVVKKIPLNRILVETDAPFLAPIPYRGKRNEPAFVNLTLAKLAELKETGLVETRDITTKNFLTLFRRVRLPVIAEI